MAKMEPCLNDIGLSMQQNKLKLNEDKTEFIAITPTRQSCHCSFCQDQQLKSGIFSNWQDTQSYL